MVSQGISFGTFSRMFQFYLMNLLVIGLIGLYSVTITGVFTDDLSSRVSLSKSL